MKEDKYLGNPLQLYGVEEYRLQGGRGDGMHLLRVRNGKGIDLTICADRCADISEVYFDGCRMNYTSACGYVSPRYFSITPTTDGFLQGFNCGMITTCGFDNIGVPNDDNGEQHGLHGTIGNTPASSIYAETLEDRIEIHAVISDERIFGRKLRMYRTITVSLEDNTIALKDRIVNTGDNDECLMLLYHINFGYPLLSEKTVLDINSVKVSPRDDHAAEDLDTWNKMLVPTPKFQEQCYYHEFDGMAHVSVSNPDICKKAELTFDSALFPYMTQWKMMGVRDYVLGCEPCTNTLEGRHEVGKAGKLNYLKPGEEKEYSVKFTFTRI